MEALGADKWTRVKSIMSGNDSRSTIRDDHVLSPSTTTTFECVSGLSFLANESNLAANLQGRSLVEILIEENGGSRPTSQRITLNRC